jgi:hypothetical protein
MIPSLPLDSAAELSQHHGGGDLADAMRSWEGKA